MTGRWPTAIAGSPVLDSYARYQYAQGIENNNLMASTENYFLNEDAMQEGSPQGILETGEDAALPPLLIIQGTRGHERPDVDAARLRRVLPRSWRQRGA